jgi:DNA recombination protein RmuC
MAIDRRVILTGPANLLALARVVSMTWRQEKLAEQATNIGDAAAKLYAGLCKLGESAQKVGEHLGRSVGAYNDFVATLEGNVLPKARALPQLGVDKGKKDLAELAPSDAVARLIVKPELLAVRDAAE